MQVKGTVKEEYGEAARRVTTARRKDAAEPVRRWVASSVRNLGKRPAGLLVTLFNWVVKPFSMALLASAFFRVVFAHFITGAEADQYIAGCIILAAAPCTAMVFVWSHLTKGDAAYTLVQVSVNDLIMLVLFVPILQFWCMALLH
jgi:ACR3 family arsenite transporter